MTTPIKSAMALDWRGARLAALAILLTAIFQGIWYIAPDLLTYPLWGGSSLNLGFLLGTFAIFSPILIAWLVVRTDRPGDGAVFETLDH